MSEFRGGGTGGWEVGKRGEERAKQLPGKLIPIGGAAKMDWDWGGGGRGGLLRGKLGVDVHGITRLKGGELMGKRVGETWGGSLVSSVIKGGGA